MIEEIDLDHIAVAVERWADAWPRFVSLLGGRWMSGGRGPGFSPAQIGFANAMRVHISQQNVARHRGQLQIFIFSQESVRVRDSIFADLRRSNT